MKKRMSEAEFLERFDDAIVSGHIFAYFQPQFNHSTGRLTGAEALMRWEDPEFGMQYPSDFIPVLEKHDILYRADIQMVEMTCRFLRKCLTNHTPVVPISFNMSRNDIYKHDFVHDVERIRESFDVPVRYLRVELTETSAIGGMALVSSVVKQFHDYGYIVEMDDFGSGYSSLNILKDLNVDVIKLDMNFLNGEIGGRGGIIIKSVVQMAKWLQLPIVVEGVETVEQADFMKSIGCNYIQGFLYSRPLPEDEFVEKLIQVDHEPLIQSMFLIDDFNAAQFWDPRSMETLIFSKFVGGAAIFSFKNGDVSLVRVNDKYVHEIGMGITAKEFIDNYSWKNFDFEDKKIFVDTINRAISSMGEEVCDTWRDFDSKCCGEDRICIRTFMQVIGKSEEEYLLYARIRNVTAEKQHLAKVEESEKKFRYATEHSESFAWEYTIATKEMRPCSRCIRVLGLPPLIENYPEPVIESGLFPPEVADMYRDWHRQLKDGVGELKAVIPLTPDRVPFIVSYTTEFDENGRALKAYGSATPVDQAT